MLNGNVRDSMTCRGTLTAHCGIIISWAALSLSEAVQQGYLFEFSVKSRLNIAAATKLWSQGRFRWL